MTLLTRDPFLNDTFQRLDQMSRAMNRLFDPSFDPGRGSGIGPAINLYTNQQAAMVTLELPGVDRDSIDIQARQNRLTIKGQRNAPQLGENERWVRRGRAHGEFTKTIALPFEIDADQVQARYKDGVLAVRVPKPEDQQPKRIAVTTD